MSYERQKRMIDGLRARGGERHVLMLQPEQQRGLEAYVAAMGSTITDALNALVAAGLAAEGFSGAPRIVEADPEPEVFPAPIQALVRDPTVMWGPFRPTVEMPDVNSTWPTFARAYEASQLEIERYEIARIAVAHSMLSDRGALYKTTSAALNIAMVQAVADLKMQQFAVQVAHAHGQDEAIATALNDWLNLIDTNQVFGHLHTNDAAMAEFSKFLRL